jgi:hypothetical protein
LHVKGCQSLLARIAELSARLPLTPPSDARLEQLVSLHASPCCETECTHNDDCPA